MLKGIRNNNHNSNHYRKRNYQNQGYVKKRNIQNCSERGFDQGGYSHHWEEEKWQNQREDYENSYRDRQYENYKGKYQYQQRGDRWGNDNFNRQTNPNQKTLKYKPKYEKENRNQSHYDSYQTGYQKDMDNRTCKNYNQQDGQKYGQFHNNELDYKDNYTKRNGKKNSRRYQNLKNKNYKNNSNFNVSEFGGVKQRFDEGKLACFNQNPKKTSTKEISSTDEDGRSTSSDLENNFDLDNSYETFFIEIYGRNCRIFLGSIESFQKCMKKVYETLDQKSSQTGELAIKLIILDQICSKKNLLSRSLLFEFKKMFDQTSTKYQNTRLAIKH